MIGITFPVSYLGWPGSGEIITLLGFKFLTLSMVILWSSTIIFESGSNWQFFFYYSTSSISKSIFNFKII